MPIERETGALAYNDGFWFIAKVCNCVHDITSVMASPASCEEHAFGMAGVVIQGQVRLRMVNGPSKKYRLFAALCVVILTTAGASLPSQSSELPLRGVNISGAELNGNKLPGRLNFDYVYPTEAELDRFASYGMTVIRLPVLWERLQPELGQALESRELGYLRGTLLSAKYHKLSLIVDLHNFGAYRGQKIGTQAVPDSAFAEFWARMAREFRGESGVMFGLMNEPNGISAEAWFTAVQAAMYSIRSAGFKGLVLVSGTGWDGAHNFVSGAGYGTPNAAVLGRLIDPIGAMAFEVHQYLDDYYSGTHPDCPAATHAASLLEPFTSWLRANGRKGFLGEVGVSARPECLAGLAAMLDHIAGNANAWLGWTYWAAGPWWSPDYMFSAEPNGGMESKQVTVIRRRRAVSN